VTLTQVAKPRNLPSHGRRRANQSQTIYWTKNTALHYKSTNTDEISAAFALLSCAKGENHQSQYVSILQELGRRPSTCNMRNKLVSEIANWLARLIAPHRSSGLIPSNDIVSCLTMLISHRRRWRAYSILRCKAGGWQLLTSRRVPKIGRNKVKCRVLSQIK